jgi:hypothetical protein
MKILHIIFLVIISSTAWCQHNAEVRYVLDGKEIDPGLLDLINLKNIDKIDIVKTNELPEVRITTKKQIEYLDYDALKKRAKVKQNENPSVMVDFKKIENEKAMRIDRDLIKKVRVYNGTIEIRTPWYRKRKKEQGNPRIVIR